MKRRVLKHMRSRRFLLICGTIIAAWMIIVLEPSKWFARFVYEDMSPHCYYRLEIWTTFYSIDNGFVRLYDAQTSRLIAESKVVFLTGNVRTFWPRSDWRSELMVGLDITIPLAAEPANPIGSCAKK